MFNGYVDDLKAKIQSRVGVFLQLREILQRLMRSSDASIASKAAMLLEDQSNLETELGVLAPKLKTLSLTDAPEFLSFYTKMEAQIYVVNELNKDAGPVKAGIPIPLIAGLIIGGIVLWRRK